MSRNTQQIRCAGVAKRLSFIGRVVRRLLAKARAPVKKREGDKLGRIHVTLNHMLLKGPPHIGPQSQDAIAAPVMAVLSVGRFAFLARAMSRNATWIRCAGASRNATQALRRDRDAGRRNKTARALKFVRKQMHVFLKGFNRYCVM